MRRLWERYRRDGDEEARNRLVMEHLPLVRYILGRLPISLPSGVSAEDLVSAGVVALLRAIEDFDLERGVEFATFAVPRIRGAMFDELRDHDIVPRSVRQRAHAIEAAYLELRQQRQSCPSVEEVASVLGLGVVEVERTLSAVGLKSFLSLEAFHRTSRGSRERVMESATDVHTATPLATLMAKERDQVVTEAVADLPEADRQVITLYYRDGLMLKEIAEVLSVTKSRVSQIHARALFRLRLQIGGAKAAL